MKKNKKIFMLMITLFSFRSAECGFAGVKSESGVDSSVASKIFDPRDPQKGGLVKVIGDPESEEGAIAYEHTLPDMNSKIGDKYSVLGATKFKVNDEGFVIDTETVDVKPRTTMSYTENGDLHMHNPSKNQDSINSKNQNKSDSFSYFDTLNQLWNKMGAPKVEVEADDKTQDPRKSKIRLEERRDENGKLYENRTVDIDVNFNNRIFNKVITAKNNSEISLFGGRVRSGANGSVQLVINPATGEKISPGTDVGTTNFAKKIGLTQKTLVFNEDGKMSAEIIHDTKGNPKTMTYFDVATGEVISKNKITYLKTGEVEIVCTEETAKIKANMARLHNLSQEEPRKNIVL